MSALTPEERRERDIAELIQRNERRRHAAAYRTKESVLREAYMAGRSAMREECARLAVLRMTAWTREDDRQSQQFRDGIEKACSDLAVKFRALKP